MCYKLSRPFCQIMNHIAQFEKNDVFIFAEYTGMEGQPGQNAIPLVYIS